MYVWHVWWLHLALCSRRMKLKELMSMNMVERGDLDLDELDMHTYYCKVRCEYDHNYDDDEYNYYNCCSHSSRCIHLLIFFSFLFSDVIIAVECNIVCCRDGFWVMVFTHRTNHDLYITIHKCTDMHHELAHLAPIPIFASSSAGRRARKVTQIWRFDFFDPAKYLVFLDQLISESLLTNCFM